MGYSEIDTDYIKVQSIKGIAYRDFLLSQLDLGETETIILAKEINADFVIIDENIAYKIAKSSELNVVRTLSILLRANNGWFQVYNRNCANLLTQLVLNQLGKQVGWQKKRLKNIG